MFANEVHTVLRNIGATKLHHANTVTTSCTFLALGGLASRGLVETKGLPQTPQSSDAIDKRYNIWHCVFVDHVDIHNRGGRRKGPNLYGPVLFKLDIDVLLRLSPETQIFVTKKNPVNFFDGEANDQRWFATAEELAGSIHYGDFDKMLVIQTLSWMISFPSPEVQINLDNPNRRLQSGEDAHTHAINRLGSVAQRNGFTLSINPPNCNDGCTCQAKYAGYNIGEIDRLFG